MEAEILGSIQFNLNKKRWLLFPLITLLLCSTLTLRVTAENKLVAAGIYVDSPPGQEVEGEAVVTYIFRVENRTTVPVSMAVRAVSSENWPLLPPPEELTLAPESEGFIVCTLLTPKTVAAGTEDQLSLVLSGPEIDNTFTVTTVVKAIRQLRWEPHPLLRAEAGEELLIPVRLSNLGTTAEQIELDVYSTQGWPVYWRNPTLNPLLPGQEDKVIISCLVPAPTPAGTVEEITLRLHDGSPETQSLKLKILITAAQNPGDQDLTIPVSSNLNFQYLPPTASTTLPWNLAWRTSGNLFANTHFDFFLNSAPYSPQPTAAYMGVTGEQWALRLGALGHNWDGLIPPPTYSSSLYYQDQRSTPWSIWVGPTTPEATPLWWGSRIDLNQYGLRLNYLHNLEPDHHFQHALAGNYQLYASPLYGWKLDLEGAVGLGETDPLTQGGIVLTHRNEKRELSGGMHTGTDFYSLNAFQEIGFTAYTDTPQDLRITSGVTWRTETPPADLTLRSNKLWTDLTKNHHRLGLAYTHRSDGNIKEIKSGTTWRRPQSTITLSANYSQEDLKLIRQALIVGSRYRYRLSADNYLEAILSESLTYQQETLTHLPELGVKWRYISSQKPWDCFGLVQWELPSAPFAKIKTFQSGFGSQTAAGTAWQIYAQLFFQGQNPVYSMNLRLQHQDLYFMPSPWRGIHGKAFVDLNRNGLYDQNEPGLLGLPVYLNGNQVTETKEDGNWEIAFTGAGRQLLEFPREYQGYYTLQPRKELTTELHKSISVLIPYLPPTDVRGQVFIDANDNKHFDPAEEGLSSVLIAVYDQNHQLITEKSADQSGAFFLTLLPGNYQLELDEGSLPDGYAKPKPLPFKVATEATLDLFIPIQPLMKEVEFFSEEIFPPAF